MGNAKGVVVGSVVVINDVFQNLKQREGQTGSVTGIIMDEDRPGEEGYYEVQFDDGAAPFPYKLDEFDLLKPSSSEFAGPAAAIARAILHREVASLRHIAVEYDEINEEAAAFRAEQLADALELIVASLIKS
jgi:hypothetical protein